VSHEFPRFAKIVAGTFNPSGVFSLTANVPNGLSGLVVQMQSFGIARDGREPASNRERVTFE
jgi:hypothetical protein